MPNNASAHCEEMKLLCCKRRHRTKRWAEAELTRRKRKGTALQSPLLYFCHTWHWCRAEWFLVLWQMIFIITRTKFQLEASQPWIQHSIFKTARERAIVCGTTRRMRNFYANTQTIPYTPQRIIKQTRKHIWNRIRMLLLSLSHSLSLQLQWFSFRFYLALCTTAAKCENGALNKLNILYVLLGKIGPLPNVAWVGWKAWFSMYSQGIHAELNQIYLMPAWFDEKKVWKFPFNLRLYNFNIL